MTDDARTDESDKHQTTESIFLSLFEVKTLRAAASFLGVVGAGGGGFATLAFGIGYLAIKKHDAMVGLPTTIVDVSTYIRTGTMFFSNTLVLIFSAPTTYVLISLALIVAIVVSVKRFKQVQTENLASTPSIEANAGKFFLGLFVLQILLFVFALLLINVQTATLHPENTNVIHQMLHDRFEVLQDNSDFDSESKTRALPDSILFSQKDKLTKRINSALRHIDGRPKLQEFYGDQVVLIVVLLSLFFSLRVWRKRWQLTARDSWNRLFGPWWASVSDTGLFVLLYILALAILVNIPTTYGVLVLPTEGAQIRLETTDNKEGSGILLTDMSSQGDTVWILSKEKVGDDDPKVRPKLLAFDRSKVSEVVLIGQITPNYLAID